MNISDVNNDGVGLDGFDPVAHHSGQPLRGDRTLSYTLADVTYYFSNEENLKRFENDPAKYIPIAGGYTTPNIIDVPDIKQTDKGYVGKKVFNSQRSLEDTVVDTETHVHNDMKEDGSVEMQNLSDSNN